MIGYKRTLDARIAGMVMGWSLFENQGWAGGTYWQGPTDGSFAMTLHHEPYFSTDLAAAFKVVEAMRDRGFDFKLHMQHSPFATAVEFYKPRGGAWEGTANTDTLPQVICECALCAIWKDETGNPDTVRALFSQLVGGKEEQP